MTTKEEIIKTTGALLAEKDYLNLSFSEIAQKAHLKPEKLKKFFKNKEELCIATIKDAYKGLYEKLSVASQAGLTLQDRIFNIIVAYSSFIIKRPEAKLIIKEKPTSNPIDQEISKLQIKLLSFLKQVVKKAEKQNSQPSSLFFTATSLIFGLISRPLILLRSSTKKFTKTIFSSLFSKLN